MSAVPRVSPVIEGRGGVFSFGSEASFAGMACPIGASRVVKPENRIRRSMSKKILRIAELGMRGSYSAVRHVRVERLNRPSLRCGGLSSELKWLRRLLALGRDLHFMAQAVG